ncbi:MAG: homoserine kinase [Acidimicrobiales bacterium]
MRATAPASSANLGPGFDALALALALAVEVTVEPAERLRVTSEGEGADLPCDATHLAARVAVEVAGHDCLHVHVRSEVPVGRGLGSSASLAVAAAAAAGAADPLAWGHHIDGHPENAAASVLGGLVAATVGAAGPMAARLPLDPGLAFVVLVPDRELPTKLARRALPATVPLPDAAFNLSRTAMLVAGLADRRLLGPELFEDRLHQAFRAAALYPEAPGLLDGLVDAGALGSCWSGAGPSLLAVCDGPDAAARVQAAGERLLAAAGLPGRSLLLHPDLDGLRLEP